VINTNLERDRGFHTVAMSNNTPPASSSPSAPAPESNDAPPVPQDERSFLQLLRSRGYTAAEKAFLEAIESGDDTGKGKQPESVSSDDFIKALAVFIQKASTGENVFNKSENVLQELATMGSPAAIQNLIASLGAVGAEDILSLDPTDKEEGFRELEAWVEGSLDMYRVCPVRGIQSGFTHLSFYSPSSDQSSSLYSAIFTSI
jgi:transcription initiation factor TFIID subunit 5